jgi:two-component system sensor histidine kinase RpfC
MNPATALQGRLSGRSDSEHEQAILRIAIIGLITLFMWARPTPSDAGSAGDGKLLLLGLGISLMLSIGIFVAIWLWPGSNAARRVVGMLADVGTVTFALSLAGESGVGLVGVYLFIIFGNGFRYGRSYLLLCQVLCLVGFISVILAAPWWRDSPYIGWGLMYSILVLPVYISTLLKRMEQAHAKTERALEECLERSRAHASE